MRLSFNSDPGKHGDEKRRSTSHAHDSDWEERGGGGTVKVLLVYYSRSGITRSLSLQLGELLGADVEEIQDMSSRKGVVGFMRSGYQALRKRGAMIGDLAKTPEDYDVVVVGTPIWAERMASPVRAYLERVRGLIPSGAFFCTSQSGGYASVLEGMADVAGCEMQASLSVTQKQVESGNGLELLTAFVEQVNAKVR